LVFLLCPSTTIGFVLPRFTTHSRRPCCHVIPVPSLPDFRRSRKTLSAATKESEGNENSSDSNASSSKDNKAMAFLRKIGRVGEKVDYTNAIGVDEGSSSKTAVKWGRSKVIKKAKGAYRSCIDSGTIDDLSEEFPITSSGTQWAGVTDRVMGGVSSGTLSREDFHGRLSNVLRANVRLENNGGFVQMATDLALDPAISNTVDASRYDGIELDVCYEGDAEKEDFNVHLKNSNCLRQFSSYRATFELTQGKWTTVQIPWSKFDGYGWGAVENVLDPSNLRRIGVVAIGKAMDVTIALSSIRFFEQN